MKADFLFVGLNMNAMIQEKTPEISTFHVWSFKNKEHQKYLNVETRLLFSPPLIKFLATRLVAPLVFTKRSCGLFVIWSMWWLLVTVHFIYRNWPNFNWLSQFLSIIVSIWAQLSDLMCFHIKCSAKCYISRYSTIVYITCIHYYLLYHHDGRSQGEHGHQNISIP